MKKLLCAILALCLLIPATGMAAMARFCESSLIR